MVTNNTVLIALVVLRGVSGLAAVLAAAYLCYSGKDGWGWFVFLALCIACFSLKET